MLPIVMALLQFAPQIARWIGGNKSEQIAQKVVDIAQTITGASTPEQALAAIQSNPDLAYRFQEAIVESQVELQRIAAELEKAHIAAAIDLAKTDAADRANARQMSLTMDDSTPRNLAYIYTAGLFCLIGGHFWLLISKVPIDPIAFGVLGNIEGVLIAMVLGAKEYFLGSSATAEKQATAITSFATDPDTQVTINPLSGTPKSMPIMPPSIYSERE